MRRLLLSVLGGILLGGIIHIAVVFAVPSYANRDAWAQMHQFGRDSQFHVLPIPEPGAEPLASLDPRMVQAVCRFSLVEGPVRIGAALPDEFWSIAVFDRRCRNIYILNDRAADRQQLDLAILTPVQMAQLRQNPPASLETAIVLEVPVEVGFALLRLFVPDDSQMPGAVAALQRASCSGKL
ncbi:DUF1254 domain-containing protein [soil metagenome]